MTELEAARVLRSQLSGPSARYDAEAVLTAFGWRPLAIRLARNEDIGPGGSVARPDRSTIPEMTVRGFTPASQPFTADIPAQDVQPGSMLLIDGVRHQVVAIDADGVVHAGRGYYR